MLRRAWACSLVTAAAVTAAGCGTAAPAHAGHHTLRGAGPAARSTAPPATPSTTNAPPPPVTHAMPTAGHPCGTTAGAPPRYQHVVWIFMENHTESDVIGTPDAPYLTSLAHLCGTDTDYAAVGSPSLPNYLGATSGSTQGVADDADPASHSFPADNLFRQVRAAGGTERSFVESMPANCTLVSQDSYAAKHNPAVYYDGPGDRAACLADDVPFTALSSFLSTGALPTFTVIVPNICDDMHSCPVSTGDQWLATWVPRLLDTSSYASGTTAVVVVFDEPTPLANVVVAPSIRPGAVSVAAVNHYSLLQATEQMLGLPLLGGPTTAPSLRAALGF